MSFVKNTDNQMTIKDDNFTFSHVITLRWSFTKFFKVRLSLYPFLCKIVTKMQNKQLTIKPTEYSDNKS